MTHTEKKKIIESLIEVPKKDKRHFWAREIKSLNILIESYPEDIFWKGLTFPQKLDSIIVLRSGFYQKELQKKYNIFKYKVPTEIKLTLGKKTGKDYTAKEKPKTITDFLS